MAEEETDIDEELDYLDDTKDEEFNSVNKVLLKTGIRLKEQWNSRIYLLAKMNEVKNAFYGELEEYPYFGDTSVVHLFNKFLEHYEEYTVKWEETINTYNDAFRTLTSTISEEYIPVNKAGFREKRIIREREAEIYKLRNKIAQLKEDYEKQMTDGLYNKEELIKTLVEMLQTHKKGDTPVDVDLLLTTLLTWDEKDKSKKEKKLKVSIKEDDELIMRYFDELTDSDNPQQKYPGLSSSLKRKLNGGTLTETEYRFHKVALQKAWNMYEKSLDFQPKVAKEEENVDDEKE